MDSASEIRKPNKDGPGKKKKTPKKPSRPPARTPRGPPFQKDLPDLPLPLPNDIDKPRDRPSKKKRPSDLWY